MLNHNQSDFLFDLEKLLYSQRKIDFVTTNGFMSIVSFFEEVNKFIK